MIPIQVFDEVDLPFENYTIGEEARLCCHGPTGGGTITRRGHAEEQIMAGLKEAQTGANA